MLKELTHPSGGPARWINTARIVSAIERIQPAPDDSYLARIELYTDDDTFATVELGTHDTRDEARSACRTFIDELN